MQVNGSPRPAASCALEAAAEKGERRHSALLPALLSCK